MYLARLLYPLQVLGPGRRLGLWFAGCKHACRGCSNPELWQQKEEYHTKLAVILELIASIEKLHKIEGFTLTGGDPFMQPEALRELLPHLRKITPDILVYTGYERAELEALGYQDILAQIAVLIDGRYIAERNNNCFLRGSDNQKIHILNESLHDIYQHYLTNNVNKVQNFMTKDGFISAGIHNTEYPQQLSKKLTQKGLKGL